MGTRAHVDSSWLGVNLRLQAMEAAKFLLQGRMTHQCLHRMCM